MVADGGRYQGLKRALDKQYLMDKDAYPCSFEEIYIGKRVRTWGVSTNRGSNRINEKVHATGESARARHVIDYTCLDLLRGTSITRQVPDVLVAVDHSHNSKT